MCEPASRSRSREPILRATAFFSVFFFFKFNVNILLRPDPNAAPLMCRTKLNKVRLRSDFGATADSYGVPAPNLIREACGKQFSMRKYAL